MILACIHVHESMQLIYIYIYVYIYTHHFAQLLLLVFLSESTDSNALLYSIARISMYLCSSYCFGSLMLTHLSIKCTFTIVHLFSNSQMGYVVKLTASSSIYIERDLL